MSSSQCKSAAAAARYHRKESLPACPRNLRKQASIAGSKTSSTSSICVIAPRSTKAGRTFSKSTPAPQSNGGSSAAAQASRAARPCTNSQCRVRRTTPAPARRRRPHRGKYGGLAGHSAGHFAAHHRRQGDGREPPHHQPAPHAGRPQQSLVHPPHRLGHRPARSKTFPGSTMPMRNATASRIASCVRR